MQINYVQKGSPCLVKSFYINWKEMPYLGESQAGLYRVFCKPINFTAYKGKAT